MAAPAAPQPAKRPRPDEAINRRVAYLEQSPPISLTAGTAKMKIHEAVIKAAQLIREASVSKEFPSDMGRMMNSIDQLTAALDTVNQASTLPLVKIPDEAPQEQV